MGVTEGRTTTEETFTCIAVSRGRSETGIYEQPSHDHDGRSFDLLGKFKLT